MCGILGMVNYTDDKIQLAQRALAEMVERGPDNQGILEIGNLLLGHSRLAIQDVSKGANQPMTTHDARFSMVFNGEVYNWRELRNQLANKYQFRTDRSDAEVLLAGFSNFGKSVFGYIDGMFAVAIHDRLDNSITLARDRAGEKPLYYAFPEKGKFVFASQISAIETLCSSSKIDHQGIYHFLTMLSASPGQTLFKDVFKLKPGHTLKISLNDLEHNQQQSFWSVSTILNQVDKEPYESWFIEAESKLISSIERQSLSDTPLAVALSGGLDSSLNLFFAHQARKRTKTQGSNELYAVNVSAESYVGSHDEALIARKFANELGVELLEIRLNEEDFWAEFEDLNGKIRDHPIFWPDMVLISKISRFVRSEKNCKVLLVGEGGDELGAYKNYFPIIAEFGAFENEGRNSRQWKNTLVDGGRLISRRNCFCLYETNKKQSWLGQKNQISTYDIFHELGQEIDVYGAEGHARRILNLEYQLRLPEILLPRLDSASMAHSVEARAPFLGKDLLEHVLSSNFQRRNNGGPKAWLYEVAKRHLPSYIYNQPKYGFGHEFTSFYNTSVKRRFRQEVLEDSSSPLFDFIEPTYAKAFYERVKGPSKSGTQIWVLYSLDKWLRKIL